MQLPHEMASQYTSYQLPPASALSLENNRKDNFGVQYPQFLSTSEHLVNHYPNIVPPSCSETGQYEKYIVSFYRNNDIKLDWLFG